MKRFALLVIIATACRADLITFPSLPTAQYAATSPIPTPPGEISFPGSDWLTPVALGPQVYTQDFFISPNIDVVGASIGIKTNGPWDASINGHPVSNVTNSTILDILPYIHSGLNVFETPLLGAAGLKVDVEAFIWYVPEPCPPIESPEVVKTPEPGGLAGFGLIAIGVLYFRKGPA